ncbi:MAG TPA: hypothetical protein VGM17_13285 [Rhizomicrobium sp.]|jgi:hypothetical protein
MRVPPTETFRPPRRSGGGVSASETANYTKDLLDGLRAMAIRQRHHRLAELLDAAAAEAERLVAESTSNRSRK